MGFESLEDQAENLSITVREYLNSARRIRPDISDAQRAASRILQAKKIILEAQTILDRAWATLRTAGQ